MKYLYYKLKLNYKGTNIGITGLTYRIRSYSLVYPTVSRVLLKDKITQDGYTENFYVNSSEFIIFIEIKDGKTQYKKYTNLINNKWNGIKVHTNAVKQGVLDDSTPYVIEVDFPLYRPFLSSSRNNQSGVSDKKHESNFHQVKSGENLSDIAKFYNLTVDDLIRNNNIKDMNKINIGMKLYVGKDNVKKEEVKAIKKGDIIKHKVNENETLIVIAKKYNTLPVNIALLNGISLDKLDYIKVGDELIVQWGGQETLIEKALNNNISNHISFASYIKDYPIHKAVNDNKVKIYGLSIGANLISIFGYGVDIGLAVDQYGDWMLFLAPNMDASFNPRDVNLHGKNSEEAWKDVEKNKDKIKKDINIKLKGIKQNIDVKFISDLKGVGFSKSHTLYVGPYRGTVSEVWAKVDDEDGERVITGQQFEAGYEVGGKKIKELAKEGKIINYEESRGKSYTFSIISDETNENARKIFIADKAIEGNK